MTHGLMFVAVLSLMILLTIGLIELVVRSLIRYYFERKERWLHKISQEEKETE